MKWFNLVIVFLTQLFWPPVTSPLSSKNNYFSQLSPLPISNLTVRNFNQQIEFNLNQTQVFLSTQKDISLQLSHLQKLLSLAKIKHGYFSRIDLSLDHPYATFQTN